MPDPHEPSGDRPTVVLGREPRARDGDESPATGELAPGTRIGPYRVGVELARGGMGTVYSAEHVLLERAAAIKVAHAYDDEHGRLHERLHREAKFLASLDHPGVVRVHDFGFLPDRRPWLAMELLTGATLGALIAREPVSVRQALRWLRGIAQALAAAHQAGVVHRDLKPDNVFVTRDDRVKVLDWGTAFLRRRGERSRFTLGRIVIGTPAYSAPEQARAEPVDGRADVYSLGIVAFEILARRVPFDGENDVSIALRHATEEPPALLDAWPEAPPRLDQLVRGMLAKRASERPDILTVDRELSRIELLVI